MILSVRMSSCQLCLLLLPTLVLTRELRNVASQDGEREWRAEILQEENILSSRHCSSPTGSVDGKILVEDDGGQMTDFTTITWQIGQ